jgi:hypothetical protein
MMTVGTLSAEDTSTGPKYTFFNMNFFGKDGAADSSP